ncbi:MAG TPA: metalloregulator ArsR/SmtB family transcription factor, partial [Steroidobacteraceae bacterium]|nr:metalloregulator ArsR/SmtB family transcription factor [Steroidobacteraceae bacterium]
MFSVEELVSLARVAADPTRLRLLALCAEKPFNVAELAAIVGQSDPLVSHHLKALLAAGVLVKKRRGKRMEYRLTAERLAAEVDERTSI